MTKFKIPIIALFILSGSALAYGAFETVSGTSVSDDTGYADVSGAESGDPEIANAEGDDVASAALCLSFQDPLDPMRDKNAETAADDEILDIVVSDPAFATSFIENCDAELKNASGEERLQIDYAIARFELARDRTFEAEQRLEGLASAHPTSAWRLAELISEGFELELTSRRFDEVLELLTFAWKGNEARAKNDLRDMYSKLLPLEKMQMPTLASSLYFEQVLPDSLATRKAMVSYFDGYLRNCEKWSTYEIEPQERAILQNARINLNIGNFERAIAEVPAMFQVIGDWAGNLENSSLIDLMKDWNTAAATPAQMLYVVDKAALQDGYSHADTLGCTTKRGGLFLDRLMHRLQKFSQSAPPSPQPGHISLMAQPVDVLTQL